MNTPNDLIKHEGQRLDWGKLGFKFSSIDSASTKYWMNRLRSIKVQPVKGFNMGSLFLGYSIEPIFYELETQMKYSFMEKAFANQLELRVQFLAFRVTFPELFSISSNVLYYFWVHQRVEETDNQWLRGNQGRRIQKETRTIELALFFKPW